MLTTGTRTVATMHELLTTAEMTKADRLTIERGTPGIQLMENAGRAVADCASRYPLGIRIAVIAGPGNNGGDGFVAARILAERGYRVRIFLLGDRARLKGDAALAAGRWRGDIEEAVPASLEEADVIIDALFGAGLSRPVDGAARALIESVNARRIPTIAVDLPSGINGDSGAVLGTAVRATQTVTFFRRKPGHFLLPGRLHCGRVHVAPIGIDHDVLERIKPKAFVNEPALWSHHFPIPQIEAHKYARGHAVVVSGGVTSTGAARLAARAALRAGAGLVTLASPEQALAINAGASLAVMVAPVDDARALSAFLSDGRRNAVLLGPGGGVCEGLRQMVLTALAAGKAVVLDADALTSFAGEPSVLMSALTTQADQAAILTPHQGEFDRLFGRMCEKHKVQQKLEQAQLISQETGAVLVLKGPDTVVAAPDGRTAIAENAPPWLATAGSGDVLAGLILGLRAQGMPPFDASAAGVWLHGEAGREAGPGLISEDLPEILPTLYKRHFADWSAAKPIPK